MLEWEGVAGALKPFRLLRPCLRHLTPNHILFKTRLELRYTFSYFYTLANWYDFISHLSHKVMSRYPV